MAEGKFVCFPAVVVEWREREPGRTIELRRGYKRRRRSERGMLGKKKMGSRNYML